MAGVLGGVWDPVDFSKDKNLLAEISKTTNKAPEAVAVDNSQTTLEKGKDAAVNATATAVGTAIGGPLGGFVANLASSMFTGNSAPAPAPVTPDGPSGMGDVDTDIVLPGTNESTEMASLDTEGSRAGVPFSSNDSDTDLFGNPQGGPLSTVPVPMMDYVGSETAMLELEKIKKKQQEPKVIWNSANTTYS
jgi:hypothetical protein